MSQKYYELSELPVDFGRARTWEGRAKKTIVAGWEKVSVTETEYTGLGCDASCANGLDYHDYTVTRWVKREEA